jgi:hypothetical protein
VADQISWTHGKHTIRTGFEFAWQSEELEYKGFGIGNSELQLLPGLPAGAARLLLCPDYPGCSAANSPAPGTNGTSFSNIFNTGTFDSLPSPQTGLIHAFRAGSANIFVQDDFKVTQRLTLNLGLRWEYDGIEWDKYGEAGNVWPSLIQTVPIPGSTPATGTLAGFVVPSNFNLANWPRRPWVVFSKTTTESLPRATRRLTTLLRESGLPGSRPRAIGSSCVGASVISTTILRKGITTSAVTQGTLRVILVPNGQANYFSSFRTALRPDTSGWTPRWVNFANGTSSNLND